MTLEAAIAVTLIAAALVALNFLLQRLARPDKGNERIAGCCGMALPEELLRTGERAEPDRPGATRSTAAEVTPTKEDHHEL